MYTLPAAPVTPFGVLLSSQASTDEVFGYLRASGLAGLEIDRNGIITALSDDAKTILGLDTAAWSHVQSILHSDDDQLGLAIGEVLKGKADRAVVEASFRRFNFPMTVRALVFTRKGTAKHSVDRFYVALDRDSLVAGDNPIGTKLGPRFSGTANAAKVTDTNVVSPDITKAFETVAKIEPAKLPSPDSAPRQPRVLLVEDSGFFRRSLTNALTDKGFSVRGVDNGEAALNCVMLERPDAIVLDMFIPRMSGMTFLRALRGNADLRDVPVVLLSGSTDKHDLDRAERLGISSYWNKRSTKVHQVIAELERLTEDVRSCKRVS